MIVLGGRDFGKDKKHTVYGQRIAAGKKQDQIFAKAVEKLVYVSSDERLRFELEMQKKWELDHYSAMATRMEKAEKKAREKGFEDGRQEGAESSTRQFIIEMKKHNFTDAVIADIVKLPIDEIMEIKA